MVKRDFLILLTIFAITSILSLPFLKPGLFLIHDDQQVARLFVFDEALRAGQFPVRWVDGLGFGFGYPLFVFYPPFVYWLGELFHFFGFGFVDSIKVVFFAGFLASGLAMYIFAKEFWGRLPATIAALFYLFVPYRALDVYIRGALAESFSFVWLPLILWSFYKLIQTEKVKYLISSAIFLVLLMITHNLIFLPFTLLLPIYLLFLITISQNRKLSVVNCLLSIVLSLTLSAFFWIPAILEKKFTIVDDLLLVNLASYKIHFVYPQQLWNWPWGFGGSAAGLADGISFKIGKLHILVSLATFILSMIHLFKKSKFSILNSQFSTVVFALFLVSAFMTTFYSKFIWDIFKPLQYLQFPWRYLIFTALFSSSLAAAFIWSLRFPILKLTSGFFLVVLLIFANFKLFKPQSYRVDLNDQKATSKETINWDVSQSSFEYIPRGVKLYTSDLGTNLVKIEKDDIPKEKVEVVWGDATLSNIDSKPHFLKFNLQAQKRIKIKVNTFYFPGWQVLVDGQKVAIDDENDLKLITFEVPVGNHQVEVKFTNTPIRTTANALSLFSIFALVIFFIRPWRILLNR